MAKNRAAQDLAALTEATQSPINAAAQNRAAADAQSIISGAEVVPDKDDKKARFALPEALATGVAAGWILGPVGGIALGVAQGILGKNAKQNVLDRFAAEGEVISGVSDTIGDELDRMELTARNADDLNQVSNMKTQKGAAIDFMSSASPRLQEQGAQMLTALQGEMTNYSDRQETQRIADEQLDAQLRRELDQEQYDRFTGMKVRFDNESRQYEDVLGATNVAMAALNEGSPAQLHAATVLINKALDPTGVVRPEEAAALGQLGSIFQKADVIVERLATGKTLLPEQRRQFQALLTQIQDGSAEIQLAREARFLTELQDAEVPTKYWDNFTMVDSVPAADPEIIADRGAIEQGIRTPIVDAIEAAVNAGSAVPDAVERAGQAVDEFGETAARTWLDIFVPGDVTAGRPQPGRGRPTN